MLQIHLFNYVSSASQALAYLKLDYIFKLAYNKLDID